MVSNLLVGISIALSIAMYGLMFHVSSLRIAVEPLDMAFLSCGGPAPIVANPCPDWSIGELDQDGWAYFKISIILSLILLLIITAHYFPQKLVHPNDEHIGDTVQRVAKASGDRVVGFICHWMRDYESKVTGWRSLQKLSCMA